MIKRLVSFGFLSLFLASCGGGASSGGSSGSSTPTKTVIGYAITNFQGSSGSTQSTSLYSDGSGSPVSSIANPSGGFVATSNFTQKTISGKTFAFAGTKNPDSIIAFALNASTGTLTQLPGITGLSYSVNSVVVSKSSNYLFAELSNGEILSYSIGTDGSLTATAFSTTLSSGNGNGSIVEDGTGNYLVAISQNSTTTFGIYLYQDNNDGTLTYKNDSLDISNVQGFTTYVADPNTTNGDYLYGGSGFASGNSTDIFILNVGELVSGASNVVPSAYATGLSGNESSVWWIDPSGTWLYTETCDSGTTSCVNPQLNQFTISSTGSLTPGSMTPVSMETAFSPFEAGYDQTTGTVISPGNSTLAEYAFSSLAGSVTAVATSPINVGSVSSFIFVEN